jgi:hypothetical protein
VEWKSIPLVYERRNAGALRAKSQESRVKGKVAIRRYGISRFALWLFVDRKMAFYEAQNGFLHPAIWLFMKISFISFTFGGNIHVFSIVRGEG